MRKFFHSGLPEQVIEVPIHATSVARCRQMGLDTTALKLRLIRIENDGKLAVLITSLIDRQQYPIDLFNDLYHKRWPVKKVSFLSVRIKYSDAYNKSPKNTNFCR